MASGNTYFDDTRCKLEVVDSPQSVEMVEISEQVDDTSQQAAKSKAIASSVRELLECPVCLNAMYPPIHQVQGAPGPKQVMRLCLRFHYGVEGLDGGEDCHKLHELGNIRCLALEKVAASLELPCKYQSFGCAGIYPYYSKLKHESQCTFRPYNCPYAGSDCTIVGDIPFLVAHLKDDHKVDMHNGSTFNHRYVKSNPHEVENATWMLTKVATSLELPCKYQSFGCAGIYPYYSKLKHESQCTFRPYNCPYAGSDCTVVGDIPFLVAHLKDDHKVDMHNGSTFNHRYVKSNPHEVENATWMLTVFSCFGQYFCLHFEAFQLGVAPVYIAFLRFMGDDSEAKNYSYSLEVGGSARKMYWQGVPRSIRDSHRKVRDSYDGLVIQRNMALFLSGGDRKELKLRVTGKIWKEQ
ncbi:hypothetical protein ACLOJK_000473 [Asimina triloba]